MTERKSDRTRATILAAARERFAADGYERATIRAIAADAAVDPALVMRYFGSKDKLFAAAADLDLGLPDFRVVPREQLGTALTHHFLHRWEHDETIQALLRAGVTNPQAAERMRRIFAGQLAPAIEQLDVDRPTTRAALVASQILGLALTRYVLAFPPIAKLSHAETVAWIAPTLTRYLTGDVPMPTDLDPTVQTLIHTINTGNREAFLATLTPDATMTDDGTPRNLTEWIDREIFTVNGHLDVDTITTPTTFTATYRNDTWGTMHTKWSFTVTDNKITHFTTGQA